MLYIFTPLIFNVLKSIPIGYGSEVQLTDGIQKLLDMGEKVIGLKLKKGECWLDIGNPEAYWYALNRSYKYLLNQSDKE